MHMPGHKRNTDMLPMSNPYAMDITEIDGFDNLHEPEDIILDSMKRASSLYRSEQTYYLVNGSTVGLLAGILGCTKKGDKVLVARNCHKAVYNALYLQELSPVYVYPEFNQKFGFYEQVEIETIRKALQAHPDIQLVILTSPTYEGVLSDIRGIADCVHEKGIPLLIDEAHGAHLGFDSYFPENAIACGADVVIHSVHKTMPSFTQTALLHVNGTIAKGERIRHYLQMLQSSSPSYLLMASIDRCVTMLEEQKEALFTVYREHLQKFLEDMKELQYLNLFTEPSKAGIQRDPSKIVISVQNTDVTAVWLYEELLNVYQIQLEMVSKDYVIAMTSPCDTAEGFERLKEALLEIDATLSNPKELRQSENVYDIPELELVMRSAEAMEQEMERCSLADAAGRIGGEYIYLYPPGIPLVVPGERISEALIHGLETYKELGLKLKGLSDQTGRTVNVIKEV